jgi:hypothetical protein
LEIIIYIPEDDIDFLAVGNTRIELKLFKTVDSRDKKQPDLSTETVSGRKSSLKTIW